VTDGRVFPQGFNVLLILKTVVDEIIA